MESERITLTGRRVGMGVQVSPDILKIMPKVTWERDMLTSDFRVNISAMLSTWQPEKVQAHWPKTWWQHFKERWFPKWALKRWPVRYEHVAMERYVAYPDFLFPRPQKGSHIAVPILQHNMSEFIGDDA